VVCLFLMQAAGRVGFSRLLARYAQLENSIPAADEAVRLSPSDPETHRTRAAVLNRLQMPAEAVKSLESAASLRDRDDYLWLELGNAREEVGNTQGALAAFDQAVRWAPYYAHTHWQRGNLLLRMGRSTEAFTELRKAAAANRNYFPNLIDLAWGISGEDLRATENLIEIKDDNERLALIRFLARKGKGKESIDQVRLLSTPLSSDNKNELARLLFAAKAFRDAFDLWADSPKLRVPTLFNGGFEEQLVLREGGFGGWILSPEQTKNKLAIDVSQKFAGTRSLQITLEGNWTPGTPLLSQTVLVEPTKTYRVSFSVRTKDLVTGGPPMFTVNDATNNQLLGKSENFPSTASWLTQSFEFTALATTEAAVIRLQRNNCDPSPCPIFGVVWLDEIEIVPWKQVDQ
jgi:tetratricopeptide (TPR) repeat protein